MDSCVLCFHPLWNPDGRICMKCNARAEKVVKGRMTKDQSDLELLKVREKNKKEYHIE